MTEDHYHLETHRVFIDPDVEPEDDLALAALQGLLFWIALGAAAVFVVLMAMKGWLPGGING